MAVVNTKTQALINADASPVRANNSALQRGYVYGDGGTVEVAAGDDDNSVYRFARLPSNAVVRSIRLLNDAITGGTAYHVGLHQTAARGGAAADYDLFATSVDLSSARVAPLDVLFEALNIDKAGQRLWQLLGLSADPGVDYDLTATGGTVGTAAGTITVFVDYKI